jgi:hypothetical protein
MIRRIAVTMATMVGVDTPAFGSVGTAVAGGVVTTAMRVGVAVAQIQFVEVVQDAFLHTPVEQVIFVGQLALVVQVVPHCGTAVAVAVAVGVAVAVAVAQIQLLDVVQLGFLQTPVEQIMLDGQSELVEHVVPH